MNGGFNHANVSYSKKMVQSGLNLSGLFQGQIVGCFECAKEALGSIKWENFLTG